MGSRVQSGISGAALRPPVHRIAAALLVAGLTGCTVHNDSPGGYTVSGTVSGLASGQQVILADDGTDHLTVANDGAFTFGAGIPYGQPYSVSVATQPSGESCAVTNGSGSSFAYDVSGVNVSCTSTNFTIGGTVTGLAVGTQLSLQDNGTDTLVIGLDGTFTFPISLTYDQTYAVTLVAQPMNQTCTLTMGTGTVTADVATVAVTCAYVLEPVVTTVSGLDSNKTLKLLLNGGDTLPVGANGTFTFTAKDAYSSPFAVTIGTQPPGQTCIVEGGVGTVTGTVTVPIVCTNIPYTIGGTVAGLAPFQQVILTDNGSDHLTVTANGRFTFASKLFYDDVYSVQVSGQPTGENCTVRTGTGTGPVTSNVTSIMVNCRTVPPENAYVINNGGPNVALFNMNAGQLTASRSALATAPTGNNPLSIALDPLDHYAYVANQADGPPGTVSEFSINPDGSLSPLSTATIGAGTGPQFVAVSPNDNAVYALNGPDATVSQYTLGARGQLSRLSPSTVATGADASANPIAMTINSTGAFAYVVNQGDSSITEFSMALNGALTAVATTSTGNGPNSVALSPNGRYLYVTNATDNTISQFSIAAGALTALSEGPIATNTTASPTSVVVDPTGTYVYVADNGNNISEYTITRDGSLAANATAGSIGTGATPAQLAFDQTGAFLFSAENTGSVDEFALAPTTGALTLEGTVSAGSNAVSIATAYLPQ